MTADVSFHPSGSRQPRSGLTTGTCAAAATAAACEVLLDHREVDVVRLTLPGGAEIQVSIASIRHDEQAVTCGVQKDAGDDPDVTHGLLIEATVRRNGSDFKLLAGEGVGIVTKPGLACAVGEPAINPVPRQMILEQARLACEKFNYTGGLDVTISIPGGEMVALKTFNPRLGIQGGLSILGTTGIVEPMSEKALINTIHVMVNQAQVFDPDTILLTPGNYGRDFCRMQLGLDVDGGVKISNFVGETLDYLVEKGLRRALLVGHLGKLVKVAGGIMNTHSRVADARMEILAAHAAAAGADQSLVRSLLACTTTQEALQWLSQGNWVETVLQSIADRVKMQCELRSHQALTVEVIVFLVEDSVMAQTAGAKDLIQYLCNRQSAQKMAD